jgi:hypothetical protein
MQQDRPTLDRLGSKVLLSNKLGLCLVNRKLALRIDGLPKPGRFAGLGNRELLPFWRGLNLIFVLPFEFWGNCPFTCRALTSMKAL